MMYRVWDNNYDPFIKKWVFEFIGMTADDRYLCWTSDHNYAFAWRYGEEVTDDGCR